MAKWLSLIVIYALFHVGFWQFEYIVGYKDISSFYIPLSISHIFLALIFYVASKVKNPNYMAQFICIFLLGSTLMILWMGVYQAFTHLTTIGMDIFINEIFTKVIFSMSFVEAIMLLEGTKLELQRINRNSSVSLPGLSSN